MVRFGLFGEVGILRVREQLFPPFLSLSLSDLLLKMVGDGAPLCSGLVTSSRFYWRQRWSLKITVMNLYGVVVVRLLVSEFKSAMVDFASETSRERRYAGGDSTPLYSCLRGVAELFGFVVVYGRVMVCLVTL